MKQFTTVLFDLDGTLTDSAPGIAAGVQYALEKFGIRESDLPSLRRFVGPPLYDSFQEYYGFSVADSYRAVDYFREYYNVEGLFVNSVYSGVEEMLSRLRSGGRQLLVATSKPEETARRVLDYFNLTPYFFYIAGASMDGSRIQKADVVVYALEQGGCLKRPETVVMVGDRRHDIAGAKANGLASIGVTYGYGSREELEKAGADRIAESPQKVTELILK